MPVEPRREGTGWLCIACRANHDAPKHGVCADCRRQLDQWDLPATPALTVEQIADGCVALREKAPAACRACACGHLPCVCRRAVA